MGLLGLLQGKITPIILSDEVLLSILKEASIRPPGLLCPAIPEYVALYRDLVRVTSSPTTLPGSHSFYLAIPLKGKPNDMFDVFKINSLPYAVPNTNYFVQNQHVSKYISFSEDRNHYFLIDNFDQCSKHHNLYVCPPLGPINDASVDTSESALFLNKPDALNSAIHML